MQILFRSCRSFTTPVSSLSSKKNFWLKMKATPLISSTLASAVVLRLTKFAVMAMASFPLNSFLLKPGVESNIMLCIHSFHLVLIANRSITIIIAHVCSKFKFKYLNLKINKYFFTDMYKIRCFKTVNIFFLKSIDKVIAKAAYICKNKSARPFRSRWPVFTTTNYTIQSLHLSVW